VKHPDADSLSLATVLGWQVVVRNDEAKEGDLIIYCEIDSLLPGDSEWLPEAIKGRVASQVDKTYFRVKTIKLRKELSQGLIVPIPKEWDLESLGKAPQRLVLRYIRSHHTHHINT
jgi:RNA ligase (TIGR02306 family)